VWMRGGVCQGTWRRRRPGRAVQPLRARSGHPACWHHDRAAQNGQLPWSGLLSHAMPAIAPRGRPHRPEPHPARLRRFSTTYLSSPPATPWAKQGWRKLRRGRRAFTGQATGAEAISVNRCSRWEGENQHHDLSPATHATTRPTSRLHPILAMLETRLPAASADRAGSEAKGPSQFATWAMCRPTGQLAQIKRINRCLWHTGLPNIPHCAQTSVGGDVILGAKDPPRSFSNTRGLPAPLADRMRCLGAETGRCDSRSAPTFGHDRRRPRARPNAGGGGGPFEAQAGPSRMKGARRRAASPLADRPFHSTGRKVLLANPKLLGPARPRKVFFISPRSGRRRVETAKGLHALAQGKWVLGQACGLSRRLRPPGNPACERGPPLMKTHR